MKTPGTSCLLDVLFSPALLHFLFCFSALFSKIWRLLHTQTKLLVSQGRNQSISCRMCDFLWTMSNQPSLFCIMLQIWSCILPQGWFMQYGTLLFYFPPVAHVNYSAVDRNYLYQDNWKIFIIIPVILKIAKTKYTNSRGFICFYFSVTLNFLK